MKHRPSASYWRLILLGASLVTTGFSSGADDDLPKAEAALKKADARETVSTEEWDSHEMARSATREIARSERKRAEETLSGFRAAEEALKKATESKDEASIAAAKKMVQERLEVMRAAARQMIADSAAGDKAAQEVIAAEHAHRDVMAAARDAQRTVLELKAKAAEKTGGKEADAARRAVHECEAFKLYEFQQ